MIKDLVRLNPSTVQLWNGDKWTQCLGWGLSSDTGERIELVLRSGERIGCTGSHVWPTQRGNVESRTLRVGDTLRMCHLPQPHDTTRPDYLTDDLLWLIGLYMAEGSRSGDTIQIALNSDEVAWLPRIKRAATDGGASMSHTLSGNTLCVRLYGKVLNAVLRDYIGGDTAKTKRFKSKVWLLPNGALTFMAEGYLSGDGHVDGNRIRLGFCRNYLLERDLRTLAARLGATLTLKTTTATYQNGTKPSFSGEWRWERSGHHNEKDRGEIVTIRASRARQFWDLSVVDDPHVFALASGVLTHNCKPNPMPESVKDRPTKAHEQIFLLSKSPKYYYNHQAIKEPFSADPKENYPKRARITGRGAQSASCAPVGNPQRDKSGGFPPNGDGRNKRSVWTMATRPFKGAHFAVFPPELPRTCMLAGCPEGGVVLDPFSGAATTGLVAVQHGRQYIGIELNPEYVELAHRRFEETVRTSASLDNPLKTRLIA